MNAGRPCLRALRNSSVSFGLASLAVIHPPSVETGEGDESKGTCRNRRAAWALGSHHSIIACHPWIMGSFFYFSYHDKAAKRR